jgi:ariadne-1
VKCDALAEWTEKNQSESENVKWILAHTKPCPKCSKPIEKNQGCNHMHCAVAAGGCGQHFCWMCGKEWDKHGGGDPYSCNIFQASEDAKNREKVREQNRNELNRYLFFFERYNGHMKARELAGKQLRKVEEKIEGVHKFYGVNVLDMAFFGEALKQISKCRRVLMYSYVYGYFLDEKSEMKGLFEHLQKNLEEKTDKLHEMIEKEFDREVLGLPEDFFRYNQDPIIAFSQVELPPVTDEDKDKVRREVVLFRSKVNNLISVVYKFTSAVITDLSQDTLFKI